MSKESTKAALDRYYSKLLVKEDPTTKRKNEAPEQESLKEIDAWAKANNIYLFRVEAKAVFSEALGRYTQGQTIAGCADRLGINNTGDFLAVEAKALGRRNTVREAQIDFLKTIIANNGFAVVADSALHLDKIYKSWLAAPTSAIRQAVLLNDLPKLKIDTSPLFKTE